MTPRQICINSLKTCSCTAKITENYFIAVDAVVFACKNTNLITSRRRSSKHGSSTSQSFQAVSTTTSPHHGGNTTNGRYFCSIFGVFSQQLEPGLLALQNPQNHTVRQHSYLLVFRKPTPQIPSIHT